MKKIRVALALLVSAVFVGGVASHSATAAPIRRQVPLNLFRTSPFPLPVMPVRMTSGPATQVVQLRLLSLGFWLKAADGNYD